MKRFAAAAILAFALPACVFGPYGNPVDTYKIMREDAHGYGGDYELPDVTIIVRAAGSDAVEVYSDGSEEERVALAEAAARWLGQPNAFATPDDFEDIATADLETSLLTGDQGRRSFSFDVAGLLPAVRDRGYDGFNLLVCHPSVETHVRASRPPEFDACFNGVGWVVTDPDLSATLTVEPHSADYLTFLAAVLLGLVILSALAWFVGNTLRTGAFRRRSPAAVAIGLIAGVVVSVGVATTIGGVATIGPSDNLALAENLGLGSYVASAAFPALVGVVPGIIFAVLLVRRRPWRDEIEPRVLPYPAPPPPPPRGGAPPPPLPRL